MLHQLRLHWNSCRFNFHFRRLSFTFFVLVWKIRWLIKWYIFTIFTVYLLKNLAISFLSVTPEVGGGQQVLGYQLTLFWPRGADFARHITTGTRLLGSWEYTYLVTSAAFTIRILKKFCDHLFFSNRNSEILITFSVDNLFVSP